MKVSVFILAASLLSAADLGDFKTVYLLPMANGLDQFLAIKLTTGVVMQVVTDPQKADAIFTGQIGAPFEQKLDDLYGVQPKNADDKGGENKDKKDADNSDSRRMVTSVARGKGAIFLVDRKTRAVIWSTYELPKNSSPDELNRVAQKIAEKLEKDRKGK